MSASSVQNTGVRASPPAVPLATTSATTLAASVPPLIAQAPPLILTQTAGGTFLVPATPGAGNASILLAAQVGSSGAPLEADAAVAQACCFSCRAFPWSTTELLCC